MKNHIGYWESTVLKPAPRGVVEQKKRFPTENPPIHTFLVVSSFCLSLAIPYAAGIEGVNLPEMFKPEACS